MDCLGRLCDLLVLMNSTTEKEPVLREAARTVIEYTNTARCVISLLNGKRSKKLRGRGRCWLKEEWPAPTRLRRWRS